VTNQQHLHRIVDRLRALAQNDPSAGHGYLAQQAGLDRNALRSMQRQDWNPTFTTLDKLAALLDAPIEWPERKRRIRRRRRVARRRQRRRRR
jgi:hypothetical protein